MDDKITIGEKYCPAMRITDKAEADAYFAECVEHTMQRFGKSRDEAETVERANLGYYAGYYDTATREREKSIFVCGFSRRDHALKRPDNAGRPTIKFDVPVERGYSYTM